MESTHEVIARLVGKRKRVLDVAEGSAPITALPAASRCTVIALRDPAPDAPDLRKLRNEQPFDVMVLHDAIEYLQAPDRTLAPILPLLAPGGYVVATIPNALHGGIMLALMSGALDFRSLGVEEESLLSFLTATTLGDLFLSADLRVVDVDRVKLGIFEKSPLLPSLTRGDFDRQLIAELERDPESDTLLFVVKAQPIAASERHRAIIDRFEETNAEAATIRRSALARVNEISRLRATITSMRKVLEEYASPMPAEAVAPGLGDMLRGALARAGTSVPALGPSSPHPVEEISAELQRAIVRNEHLSERVDESDRQLVELLEGLIVATQAESARLALLIDTVQSSRFWRAKRFVSRLLHRGG